MPPLTIQATVAWAAVCQHVKREALVLSTEVDRRSLDDIMAKGQRTGSKSLK